MKHNSIFTFSAFFAIFVALSGCSSTTSSSSLDLGTGGKTTQPNASMVITWPSPNDTVTGNVRVQIAVSDSTPNLIFEEGWVYIDGVLTGDIPESWSSYDWETSGGGVI